MVIGAVRFWEGLYPSLLLCFAFYGRTAPVSVARLLCAIVKTRRLSFGIFTDKKVSQMFIVPSFLEVNSLPSTEFELSDGE